MNNRQEIGRKIKTERLALNLRAEDISKKTGITRSTLWSIESGRGNYTIDALLKVLNFLNMSLRLDTFAESSKRRRATRINTALDKKINRFLIMCIEQYAFKIGKDSRSVYKIMNEKGIINELIDDYEDMHGMSTYSLNEYIESRLSKEQI